MAPLSQLFARITASTTSIPTNHHFFLSTRALPPSTKTQPVNPNYKPGGWAFDPHHINNKGFFALFALIGVALVLASIWFFFWAKNGGFHFHQGDWDDYKSTVLRRKGPNGTTLSGATKTTRLGGGSVVAGEAESSLGGYDEKVWKRGVTKGARKSRNHTQGIAAAGATGGGRRGKKNGEDDDVRAYRHEKPARVGGLNRDSDGISGHDFATGQHPASYPAYSDYSSAAGQSETSAFVPINTPRKNNHNTQAPGKRYTADPRTPSPTKNHRKSAFYATPASNNSTDSHRPLRPNAAQPGSADSTPTRSRNSSPRKSGMPGSYTEALDFESRYGGSDAGLSEDSRGTKAYFHPIPGLSGDGGRRTAGGGFRRGRGRRDSLSDREEETVRS